MQKVRKAVIPAAGFGTRFLPATKACQHRFKKCRFFSGKTMLLFTGFCRKTTGDCLFSPVDHGGSSGVFFLERCSRSSL